MKKVLILAGGTGGHIFPALAVADRLKKNGVEIVWMGSKYGLEKKLVQGRYPIHYLPIPALRQKGFLRKLTTPFYLLFATLKAVIILLKEKPDVALSMGGYAAAPGGIAAKILRVPLVVHEQNAKPGLTNRFLSKLAKKCLQAFPLTFAEKLKPQTVGNPVRDELMQIPHPAQRFAERAAPLRVLILGGSQGAQAINQTVLDFLQRQSDLSNYEFLWQAGEKKVAELAPAVKALNGKINVVGFIEDMLATYSWADCVICRSGAMTVSEIAAVGLPAVFVPFPHAVDDHQYYNAKALESVEAAIIVRQSQFTPERLSSILMRFSAERDSLLKMALCAKNAAQPNSTTQITEALALCSKT